MFIKNPSLLLHLFCNVDFEFTWSYNTKQSSEILIIKTEMVLEFQNKTKTEILGV